MASFQRRSGLSWQMAQLTCLPVARLTTLPSTRKLRAAVTRASTVPSPLTP
jgi:hypothetical protein